MKEFLVTIKVAVLQNKKKLYRAAEEEEYKKIPYDIFTAR